MFLKDQKMTVDKYKQHNNNDPRLFVVLDDCLHDNTWTKDKQAVMTCVCCGRHWKNIIYDSQCNMHWGYHQILSTNIDYVFILRQKLCIKS